MSIQYALNIYYEYFKHSSNSLIDYKEIQAFFAISNNFMIPANSHAL